MHYSRYVVGCQTAASLLRWKFAVPECLTDLLKACPERSEGVTDSGASAPQRLEPHPAGVAGCGQPPDRATGGQGTGGEVLEPQGPSFDGLCPSTGSVLRRAQSFDGLRTRRRRKRGAWHFLLSARHLTETGSGPVPPNRKARAVRFSNRKGCPFNEFSPSTGSGPADGA